MKNFLAAFILTLSLAACGANNSAVPATPDSAAAVAAETALVSTDEHFRKRTPVAPKVKPTPCPAGSTWNGVTCFAPLGVNVN